MSVEITPAQASALAELAAREGSLNLHQLAARESSAGGLDVYATPGGTHSGYRITPEGTLSPIGDTLPAEPV